MSIFSQIRKEFSNMMNVVFQTGGEPPFMQTSALSYDARHIEQRGMDKRDFGLGENDNLHEVFYRAQRVGANQYTIVKVRRYHQAGKKGISFREGRDPILDTNFRQPSLGNVPKIYSFNEACAQLADLNNLIRETYGAAHRENIDIGQPLAVALREPPDKVNFGIWRELSIDTQQPNQANRMSLLSGLTGRRTLTT